jgi:hypothetical protein
MTEQEEKSLSDLFWNEYTTFKTNHSAEMADYEANLDIVACKRSEKDYDWMSDLFIPEAPSIFLTEDSQDATQYFASRDFVDVYLEGTSDKDKLSCSAAKKLINKMLNNKRIYHFHKYMQAVGIIRLAGYVYIMCWWDQKVESKQVNVQRFAVKKEDPATGQLIDAIDTKPVMDDTVYYDHFNWQPIDPRNVFTDNTYCYSAQQERAIIIRSEKSYTDLKSTEKENGYINLDKLLEIEPPKETDTSQETYNKDEKYQKSKKTYVFDTLERYGKQWAIVQERDSYGNPSKVLPGIDENGQPLKDAEYVLLRQTMVYKGSHKIMIRFQAEPLRDGDNQPYMPIIRGLCYVHPSNKNGMSDAKYLRELQVGENDFVNIAADRSKLAGFPSFYGSEQEADNMDEIYIEPEHFIPLKDPATFKELAIRDDTRGSIEMYQLLKGVGQQVTAVYPNTMGDVGKSSVTATAVAGADMRSNVRNNYKSLTKEYTLLNELYWQILQMSWQFMHVKTAKQIFEPEEMQAFNAVGDYTYQPITNAIEQAHSKNQKISAYDQNIGRLVGLVQFVPELMPLIVKLEGEILKLQGAEYRDFEGILSSIAKAKVQIPPPTGTTNQQMPTEQVGAMPMDMTSNQNGVPVQGMEQNTRMQANQ